MKCCVIGLGRFGYQVATTLAENGVEVMAVDSKEEIIDQIKNHVTQAICMHVTDEASLRSIGVDEMDVAVVAIGEDLSQSIMISVFLKKGLNIPRVIARAVSDIHKDILKLVGADRIVQPEKEIAVRVADGISASFTDLVRVNNQFSIIQLVAPKSIIGMSIFELDFLSNYNVHCIGLKDSKDIINPIQPSYIVKLNDKLIFAGKTTDLNTLAKM